MAPIYFTVLMLIKMENETVSQKFSVAGKLKGLLTMIGFHCICLFLSLNLFYREVFLRCV